MPDGDDLFGKMDENVDAASDAKPKKIQKRSRKAIEEAPAVPHEIFQMPGSRLQSRRYVTPVEPENMAWFLESESTSLMKRIIESLVLQVNEIRWEFKQDGISIRGRSNDGSSSSRTGSSFGVGFVWGSFLKI